MNIHSSCTCKRETFEMGVKSTAIESNWEALVKTRVAAERGRESHVTRPDARAIHLTT
jgi:hypothetical protein